MIVHDIDTIGTPTIDFLHRIRWHWCARKQVRPRVTFIDLMFIEKSKEDKSME